MSKSKDAGAPEIRKCGLVMPISTIDGCDEGHWLEVKAILTEALKDTNLVIDLVSNADEVGVIQSRIVQNIYDNDIIVCDVSCRNANVMFELGMRLAFDRPVVIIKDDKTPYSFDTAPVEHLTYPRDLHYHQITAFKEALRKKVLSTLEASAKPGYKTFLQHFGTFVVAKVEEKEVGKDEYILRALDELQRSVTGIQSRMQTGSSHRSSLPDLNLGTDKPSKGPMTVAIDSYLEGQIFDIQVIQDLCDPGSPEFKKLFAQFLEKNPAYRGAPIIKHCRARFSNALRQLFDPNGSLES